MTTLAERLGYRPDDRLADRQLRRPRRRATPPTSACYEALRDGVATSASLMVPCPWAREAAARYRGEDIGVHLTLNAEHDLYRWGPITHAPSLLDGDGGFPRTVDDLWDHADLDEVRRECRAQIERAILWGFDVSHLDVAHGRAAAAARVLRRLPRAGRRVRAADPAAERGRPSATIGFPFRRLAAEEGVLFPDHFTPAQQAGSRERVERHVRICSPGVTEVHVHPAVDTPEVRALSPDWAAWVDDHQLVVHDEKLADTIAQSGAHLIGFRQLRAAQREG